MFRQWVRRTHRSTCHNGTILLNNITFELGSIRCLWCVFMKRGSCAWHRKLKNNKQKRRKKEEKNRFHLADVCVGEPQAQVDCAVQNENRTSNRRRDARNQEANKHTKGKTAAIQSSEIVEKGNENNRFDTRGD